MSPKNQIRLIEAGLSSGRKDATGPSNPRLSTLSGLAEVMEMTVSALLAEADVYGLGPAGLTHLDAVADPRSADEEAHSGVVREVERPEVATDKPFRHDARLLVKFGR